MLPAYKGVRFCEVRIGATSCIIIDNWFALFSSSSHSTSTISCWRRVQLVVQRQPLSSTQIIFTGGHAHSTYEATPITILFALQVPDSSQELSHFLCVSHFRFHYCRRFSRTHVQSSRNPTHLIIGTELLSHHDLCPHGNEASGLIIRLSHFYVYRIMISCLIRPTLLVW